ncbi:MAG: DUF4010 domain-containing protein, partial [Alphaproteobacteria bacterium]
MGLFGGLASTTALTFTASRLAKKHSASPALLAASVSAGNAVMFLRTLVIIAVINFSLVPIMVPPLLLGSAGALLAAYIFQKKVKTTAKKPAQKGEAFISSPANLVPAFSFALLLAVILVLTYYAKTLFAEEGVLGLAALSGLVDVDAITISLSKMAGPGDTSILDNVFIIGVFVAILSNSLSKTGIAFFLGTRAFGIKILTIFGFALVGVGLGLGISLL